MNSGGLVPQGNFPQNGTVDWIRLGDGMVSFSLGTLARMTNYDIDAGTLVLATIIAQQLPLSPRGENRVRDAIEGLKLNGSFDRVLFFGFGLQCIPRLLATTTEGLALGAISAALSEVYHENHAANVLYQMLLLLNPTREFTPSLQRWSKIIKACAGTFATTSFGRRAEHLMSLHPSETSVFPTTGEPPLFDDSWRSRSSARDIAEALINLGEIARGKMESITIVGGGDAGFLAAVAEWLFDMNIRIVDGKGELLHSRVNSEPRSTIHAQFVFKDRLDESPSQSMDLGLFKYPRKTFHLTDVSEILFTNWENEEILVSGRLEWSRCLSSAFGSNNFEKLKDLKSNFGTALGCAARIFEAVANAEREIDFDTRKNWIYYTDAGRGHGFVQNLTYWFPELKYFETQSQEAASFSYLGARIQYESSVSLLRRHCVCANCTPTRDEQAPNGHCLVVILETILKAALILSNVSVEPGLEPRRIGLVRLYQRQLGARSQDRDTRERMEKGLGPIVWVIEPEKEDERLYTVDHRVRLMIDDALGLFTYLRGIEDSTSCAFASGGICAYRKILERLSIHDTSGISLGRIHIIPGKIEWRGIAYDRVQNLYEVPPNEFRLDDEQIDVDEMDFKESSFWLEESLDVLKVTYRLSNSRQRVLNIAPGLVANYGLEAHGLVHYQQQNGCNHEFETFDKDSVFQVQTLDGKEVSLYRAPNHHSVGAVLGIAHLLEPEYCVILDDRCTECAVQRAVAETADRILIVSYK